MTSPVDPNALLMTGENSFIRLSQDGGTTTTDVFSHWRVLWCPMGPGCTLFVRSELSDHRVQVYSDNIAVTRWLQSTIESVLQSPFGDTREPVVAARFDRSGDPRSAATERVVAGNTEIILTWYDFMEGFVLNAPPGFNNRPLGVFSTFFPARSAQVSWNGRVTRGTPWPQMRGDRQSSSACLAWSETWVRPRA
ncbi:MAG: hypothetical protein QN178_17435 [Armatimonadota bacterium]|nr:hypothetical protein [Armatimonadota bacterium]